jgi:hypothetical protein
MLFIILTLMLLKNPTHKQGFKKFQLSSQICLYYCIFCIMKQKKMKQTNWTHHRKSANTPLLWLIFACTLSLKRNFGEFLEAQLRSSKGVFLLFLLTIWVQFCLLHVVKLKVTCFFCFIQNVTPNLYHFFRNDRN